MRNFQMEQQIRPRRRPPIASCGGGERVFSMGVALVLFLALPFASPFASGTSLYNNASPRPGVPPRPLLTTTRPMAAGEVTTTPNDPKRFSSLRRFIARFTPNKHKSWSKSGGEEQASLSSKLLFRYATPLLQKASEERLEAEDSFDIASDRQMHHSVTRLARIYEHVKSTPQNSNATPAVLLTKALLWHQRPMLLTTGVLRLLNTAIQAFPAILIARLLKLVEAGDALPAHKALTAAVTLVAVLTTKMIVENQYFHRVVQCSTQVRGALAGLIFDKSLRLPAGGGDGVKGETSSSGNSTASSSLGAGAVLNLMQSDASIIESAAMQIHTLWDGPLQIAIYTSLLFRYLGPSVWWGILVLLTTIPVNSVALRALNRLAKYENQAKDARTKRTAESISNMKLLKLQGWEERFANDIRGHRSQELRRHVSRGLVRAINSAISNAVPSLVLVVTLTAFVKTGKPIKASTIFTAISLFNQLRYPLFFYPMLVDSLANGRNAMRRISTFLSSEEIVPYVQHLPPHGGGGGSIELQHGNFLWSTARGGSPRPALSNVNLKVNPGEVVAVVGSVGSGKSALVKALLGELNPVPGMVIQHAIFNDNNSNDRASTTTTDVFEKPTVVTHGNVAYCSQEAWLPKGTIKDAIVFGREYDETRYLAAIRDAGLDKDIVDSLNGANSKSAATSGVLSHDTDVGEGGSSLSGGQRARVALARALYSGEDTKVFLLDDSLAALDASVGSTVFERLTRRLRGSNAAVVLVTNDPSLPRRCDRVVLMGNVPNSSSCSTVVDTGTYDELLARGHNLRSIASVDLERSPESSAEEVTATTVHADGESHTGNIGTRLHRPKFTKIRGDRIRVVGGYNGPSNCTDSCHADPECQAAMEKCPDYASDHALSATPETSTEVAEKEEILVDVYKANSTFDEAMAESSMDVGESSVASTWEPVEKRLASADDSMSVGAVPRSIYVSYFKSVRQPLLVFAMVAFYLVSNGAQFYQQFVVAKWTEVGSGAMAAALNLKYMRRLVQAAGVVSLSLWLRSVMTMQVGVRASEHLHSQMLSSVFKAPMSFFDATPSGQLLSRFGKEMETVDRGVPDSMQSVLFCFLQIFMSIGALAGVVTPAMLAPIFVVGVLYGKAMSMFRPASRDLKRAETKTRSPIYTHFGEALRGTDTIRSIPGARQYWSEKHRSLTDKNLGVFYTVKALDRWLSTRLETLGNTVVLTAAVASVLLTRAGRLKSGSAGWGLTQSLAITGLLTWAVRCLTDLESNMMSVMRVKELTNIDNEQSVKTPNKKKMPKELSGPGEALVPLLPHSTFNTTLAPLDSRALVQSGWPWQGNIQFSNVSMRYNSASPLVLNDVTLTVPAATTLGVVGRTGSGKSSLLLTLFRLVEIEDGGGSIEIDGVDIRSVGLEQLRQSLAIIPQDPVLFAGSVAYNLDATGRASPDDMWAALQAASPSLVQQFRNSEGLDTQIAEGGKNLSLGQRQLICLARALLRKSKILVLDEATSSVDSRTDQEVQDTIRREFVDKGVTVITVAHRLDTVLGYDKIAVLGNGKVLEYGTPSELLSIPGGELRQLVDADRRNKLKGAGRGQSKETAVAA